MAIRPGKLNIDISVSGSKNKKKKKAANAAEGEMCAWDGCDKPGPHPAPKGPRALREYQYFCAEHIKEFNKSWNFFKDMPDDMVEAYARSNATWQRPTWKMNTTSNKGKAGTARKGGQYDTASIQDPFDLFDDGPKGRTSKTEAPVRPRLTPMTEEALAILDLDAPVTLQQVKRRYKELVKRFHPDANGGDRSTEEQLKKIIWAYNHLKASRAVRT